MIPGCDMEEGCREVVTHIDEKGFIYCARHGAQRKLYRRCRKLTAAELKLVNADKPIARY